MLDRLPKEIAEDILSRLPLKSLLRCTCVSKSLRCLIKSPSLISAHLRRSISSAGSKRRAVFQGGVRQELCLFPIDRDQQHLKLHMKLSVPAAFYRFCSCNGLVSIGCYGSHGSFAKFVIWNPSIGKHLILPAFKDPDNEIYNKVHCGHAEFHGLGYDFSAADYKLVRVMQVSDGLKVHVFSINTCSWTSLSTIESRYEVNYVGNPVVANGKIHWLVTDRCEYILGFDVGDNSFFEISAPQDHGIQVYELFTAYGDSSLALTFDGWSCAPYRLWLWVMKEYGVAGSWIKISVEIETIKGGCARVLGFNTSTTNEIIIVEDDKIPGLLLSVDCITKQVKFFGVAGNSRSHYFLAEFIESLALLDKENEHSNHVPAAGIKSWHRT